MVDFFLFLKLIFAIFGLVQDVEAIFHLPQLLTTSGNLFPHRVMPVKLLFTVSQMIAYISEKISTSC